MNNKTNYKSSIDTIVLTQNVPERAYNKARNNQSVNVGPYTCERSGSNYKKALELNIRHKEHQFNFMHIDLKELPNRETFYLRIAIHLNHFIHQAFPSEPYVKSEKIIEVLGSIIREYLMFPGFNLDVMNVGRIDIAMDFLVNKDPSHYLNLIKHKEIPRYLLRYYNSNSTLSIHSYSYKGASNPKKDSTHKGAIYNKADNLGINKNIIRFEFRLEGDQIYQLPLETYNQQGYYDITSEEKSVTKFSDIFSADIGEQLKKRFIDGVILKDSEEYEATESHDNYITKYKDFVYKFNDAEDYCRRLAPLLKEKDEINKAIRELCEEKALDQMRKSHNQEIQLELWDLIEENLKDKFIYQLQELDTPVNQTISHLKNLFSEMALDDFIKELRRIIPRKKSIRVDHVEESTFKVILNYFKKEINNRELVKEWKVDSRRDINNRINSLHNDFKIHNKCMFILHYYYNFDGTVGHELYDELKTLANSYNFTPSENVFNLYRYYVEQSTIIEAT